MREKILVKLDKYTKDPIVRARNHLFLVAIILVFLQPVINGVVYFLNSRLFLPGFMPFFRDGSMIIGASMFVLGAAAFEMFYKPSTGRIAVMIVAMLSGLLFAIAGAGIYASDYVKNLRDNVVLYILVLVFFVVAYGIYVCVPKER